MTTTDLRELDAQVAKLMGWKFEGGVWWSPDHRGMRKAPSPTTDPAALADLKRWLREHERVEDIEIVMNKWLSEERPPTWKARIGFWGQLLLAETPPEWHTAPTEGEALALAVVASFGEGGK